MSKLLTILSLEDNLDNKSYQFYKDTHSVLPSSPIVAPIDRTRTFQSPINFKVPDRLVLSRDMLRHDLSYRDCCLDKAKTILDIQDRIQKPIVIHWSGGIDSTAIICSFIILLGINETSKRIEIAGSTHGIYEYPLFFKKFILPNFTINPSSHGSKYLPPDYITVDGDPNGPICGGEAVFVWSKVLGIDILKKPITCENLKLLMPGLSTNQLQVYCDLTVRSAKSVDIELSNLSEWYWWYNLNFRYQWFCYKNVLGLKSYRPDLTIDQEFWDDHSVCFFDSSPFQAWSVNYKEKVLEDLIKGKWKDAPKQLIFEVTKDSNYLTHKLKLNSAKHRFFEKMLYGIDDGFQTITKESFSKYIVENNSYQEWI